MVRDNKKNQDVARLDLREYVSENFLPSAGINAINDSDSFMEKGVLDSTGVLELIAFIEDRFGIEVDDHEIIPDNLDSLEKLTNYVERKLKDVIK